jgi:ABC-2 type transport system permease protein
MRGLRAVLKKELVQVVRDKASLKFALMVPVFQLILFGLIDQNVKHVPTVVLDQDQSTESRALVNDFVSTSYFEVVGYARSRAELRAQIVAGRAAVAVEIPPDYSRARLEGRPADFLVLIDGSDSSISSQSLSAANGLAMSRSLEEMGRKAGVKDQTIRPFPQLLFNPDSRSANLLLPGLVAILLTFSGTMLAAFSIVKERERGTLEQLMVTPVSGAGVVLGKLFPYLVTGFVQLVLILLLMRFLFQVPIHGSVTLLVLLSTVYLIALLALGLMISAHSKSQMEAIQRVQGLLLPSVFLSGYVFPISSLPEFLQYVSKLLPATHFIAISRGIIIRGATLPDLWPNVAALLVISTLVILAALGPSRRPRDRSFDHGDRRHG